MEQPKIFERKFIFIPRTICVAGSEKQNVSLRKTLVSKFAERPL